MHRSSSLTCRQLPDIKQRLIANVDDAVARGVFGSPSFFVGSELYFGKDQLRDVEEEIERSKGADPARRR